MSTNVKTERLLVYKKKEKENQSKTNNGNAYGKAQFWGKTEKQLTISQRLKIQTQRTRILILPRLLKTNKKERV